MSILQRKPSLKENKDDINWAFKKYDHKNKGKSGGYAGYIDIEDFKRVARELEQDFSEEEIGNIMEMCGSGNRIGLEEFQKLMTADLW